MCRLLNVAFVFQDVYILSSSSVLVLVCIWHAIVIPIQASYGVIVASIADVAVLIALGSLYFLTHVILGFWITVRVSLTAAISKRFAWPLYFVTWACQTKT
jgi:hypothetical protein